MCEWYKYTLLLSFVVIGWLLNKDIFLLFIENLWKNILRQLFIII